MPVKHSPTLAYAFSALLAGLMIVSSVAGLLYGGRDLYDAYPATLAGFVGQDIVTLTAIVPLLLFGDLRLWWRTLWGYLLGGLLLVKVAATGFTMAFTTALGAWWARAVDPFQAFLFVLFVLMMAGALDLLVPYLRSIEGGSR
jgi:hypothetical protein